MGGFMDAYASNKRLFTQQEFEANYVKITSLTHAKGKLDALANQIEKEQTIKKH